MIHFIQSIRSGQKFDQPLPKSKSVIPSQAIFFTCKHYFEVGMPWYFSSKAFGLVKKMYNQWKKLFSHSFFSYIFMLESIFGGGYAMIHFIKCIDQVKKSTTSEKSNLAILSLAIFYLQTLFWGRYAMILFIESIRPGQNLTNLCLKVSVS